MGNANIKEVDGGETTAPVGTEGIELDNGTTSTWIQMLNLVSRKLRETAGPTVLSMGAVADGEYLKRSGSSIISAAISGGGGTNIEGSMYNGKISVSVASNNITVALKTLAGADPSSGDPVKVRIGDTERSITAALSVTKNAGTNWCNAGSAELATKEIDYFVYLGYNATDGVVIGFSRIPYAAIYSDFSTTSTNEKYCAISTITNAASGDNYVNIGRFAATLSAGAGYTWTVPTFTGLNLIQRPIYESRVLAWQPAYSATGSMTYTSVTTSVAEYRVVGRSFACDLVSIGTTGGTAAAGIRATLPFSARNYAVNIPSVGWTADGSGTIAACMFVDSTTANLLACRRYDGANYGLGTNRYIALNASFTV